MADQDVTSVSSPLRVVITGHVDHGKSSLIARLVHDTGGFADGKKAEIEKACAARDVPFEWSFLLDAFQAERDQAVTIDTTRVMFKTAQRSYAIIDAPGHREFIKNMMSGAAAADAAVLVVDAGEGLQEQTRRHAYILNILGLTRIIVVINKMDKAAYDAGAYQRLEGDITTYLSSIGMSASHIIPVSVRDGEMMVSRGARMDWYAGPTFIDALDTLPARGGAGDMPLRFCVQDVYRFDEKRIIVGRVESGRVCAGDTLVFSPTNERAVVDTIEAWPKDSAGIASAGDCIGITLTRPAFVERGYVGSHDTHMPCLAGMCGVRVFWLSDTPLKTGNAYHLRVGTADIPVSVQSVEGGTLHKNASAEVMFKLRAPMPLDSYEDNPVTGRGVIFEGDRVAGAGLIRLKGCPDMRVVQTPKSTNITNVNYTVTADMRARRNGHYGGVFWFTGLSGAGKSTLAVAAEKELFNRGINVHVLDGDNVRRGLSADLGFSPEDRNENIRRIGEVAALQADAGLVVMTSFISPYQAGRDSARRAAPGRFHEIYIRADIATCEKRDPKGLYRKARAGEILDFTGIGSPYEVPVNPDLIVDTQGHDVAACVRYIVDYITRQVVYDDVPSSFLHRGEKSFERS